MSGRYGGTRLSPPGSGEDCVKGTSSLQSYLEDPLRLCFARQHLPPASCQASRTRTKVKSQYTPAREGLGLPGEDRGPLVMELQGPAIVYHRSQEAGPRAVPGGRWTKEGRTRSWIVEILLIWEHSLMMGFPGGSDGKESACNAGDPGWISGSGSSPGEGNGYPPQYSCLENSMDRGAWWVTVHGITKSRI